MILQSCADRTGKVCLMCFWKPTVEIYSVFWNSCLFLLKKIGSIQFILFQFSDSCNTPHTVYVGWFCNRMLIGLIRCVWCVSANHQWRYTQFSYMILVIFGKKNIILIEKEVVFQQEVNGWPCGGPLLSVHMIPNRLIYILSFLQHKHQRSNSFLWNYSFIFW